MTEVIPWFVDCERGVISFECDEATGCWHTGGFSESRRITKQMLDHAVVMAAYFVDEHLGRRCDACHEQSKRLKPLPFLYKDANHPRKDSDGYVQLNCCPTCFKKKVGEED